MFKRIAIASIFLYGFVCVAFFCFGHFGSLSFGSYFVSVLLQSSVVTCVILAECLPVILAIVWLVRRKIGLPFLILLSVIVFCVWTFLFLNVFLKMFVNFLLVNEIIGLPAQD